MRVKVINTKPSTVDLYEDGSLRVEFITAVLAVAGINLFNAYSVNGLNAFMREHKIYRLMDLAGYCQSYLSEYSDTVKKLNPDWCWDYIDTVKPAVKIFLAVAESLTEIYIDGIEGEPVFVGFAKLESAGGVDCQRYTKR